MAYNAHFECINGCITYKLNEIVYTCEVCGDLLQVVHDVDALNDQSPAGWSQLFDSRYKSTTWPYGSAVWGKKEWVLPEIDDNNVVSMYEGASNLFWAERFGERIGLPDLWIKLCGNAHTGSFKDLGMTVLVSQVKQMISEGQPIRAIACASTGDTSAALAAYASSAGIPSVIFLPKNKVSTAQLIQPVANGAMVMSLETDFDGCMDIVKQISQEKGFYLANSMNSLRIEGQKTVSIELVQQLDWTVPDWVIIPGGNLGNVSALGKGFLLMEKIGLINKRPRIAVAQAHNANPLYESYLKEFKVFEAQTAKKTLASAIQIGNPVSIKKAIRTLQEFNGVVVDATEDELANACADIDRTGLFTCPHTGVALAGMLKLKDKGLIKRDDKVVVISTAHGLKFTEFKVNYHMSKLADVQSRYANTPIEAPANLGKVKDTLFRELDKYEADAKD